MRRRRLLALCAAFALLAPAVGAGAAPSPVKRAPSLLWKSYPLKQRTASSQLHPLRPPALADGTGSSSGSTIFSPYLAVFSLLGEALLAATGLVAKSRFRDGAVSVTAGKGRSAKRVPIEDAKPDMLVALRPTSMAAEEEPDLAEPETTTPSGPLPVPLEGEGDAESEPPPSAPLRLLPILLAQLRSAEEEWPEGESRPLRALPHPLLRALDEQQPETGAPAEEGEPEAESRPVEVAAERAPEPESEEGAEVALESCQIRLWRGYFRYQLFAESGSSGLGRPLALSPYFRLKDPEAPGDEASAALLELLEQLKAEGWTITREGRHWYSFLLERPL